jgi:anti-sigma factor RsiW
MDCHDARRHWNLYHDSEGDAELHFQVSEHLAVCPGCAEWFSQQSRLEALLAEKLGPQPPTPALWDRVLGGSGLRPPARSRRWLVFLSAAACAAALLLAALWHWRGKTAQAPDLARLSAERHQRLAAGEDAVQFRSRSDLEVEAYLRKRVSFPVRCPPRKDAGFAVQGAGVCTFGDQPAAYLTGRVGEAPVSIFVLPRHSLAAFPHQEKVLRAEKTHRRREGRYAMVLGVIDRNAVLVIGQTDPGRLERVLSAYGTYPDHH